MTPDPSTGGLGTPHHTAYVVESIEVTVEKLHDTLDAGPFLLIEKVPLEEVTSGGGAARLGHHSAFGSCGGRPVELMQILDAAPEAVATKMAGGPRLHHVGYALPPETADAARERLVGEARAPYLDSRLGEGHGTFHDFTDVLGHDLEIQDEVEALVEFFAMVLGAAEGWDGSDLLRPVG